MKFSSWTTSVPYEFFVDSLEFEAALRVDGSQPTESIKKYKETYENDAYLSTKNKFKEYNKKAQNFIQQFKIRPDAEQVVDQIKPPTPFINPNKRKTEESNVNFDATAFISSIVEQTFEKNIVNFS